MSHNQAVIFELSGVRYGIDILQVQEIIRLVEITPVSEADVAVEGIINLRGQVISVVNLSRKLELPENEKNNDTRIIVVESKKKKIGLVVDRVLQVGTYTDEEMEEPSSISSGVADFKGIIKKTNELWLLLNLEEVV